MEPLVKLTPPVEGPVLLHACCAPCSGAVLECMVNSSLDVTVFFSNSNIAPRGEYDLRLAELKRYCSLMGVGMVEDVYDHRRWLDAVKGLEGEPERGGRCLVCFRDRLACAARYAASHGFKVLATTLASSRWKSAEMVARAGSEACEGTGVVFWAQDWRKGGLQQRRSEVIRERGFYNQTFCGCEFSRQSNE